MTYLELRLAIRDMCPIPAVHDHEVETTGCCTVCGWYGAMSLRSMENMLIQKVEAIS